MEQDRQGGNATPQTLSHNLHGLAVPGLSRLHLLPILNSFALPSALFLSKTALNLILITAKTKMVFVCNSLRRLFGKMSVIDNGNVVLRGFKRFSGSTTGAVARGWAVPHYSCYGWRPAGPSCIWPGQNNLSPTPTVTLRIRELACSNSVEFPMRCGEGGKPVTVLIWLSNSLYFDMHCLKINVWNWRHHYH